MGCAELGGDFEIAAHPHRKRAEAISRGDHRQKGEMRGRRLVRRRNAHQSFDREAEFLDATADELVGRLRRNPGFLGFAAGIDLNEEAGRRALARDLFGKGRGDLRAVDGFDDVKQRNRIGGLVGLQRSYEAKLDSVILVAQSGPFPLGFLNAVLAENALARGEGFPQLFFALGFRNGDQLDRAGAACFLQSRIEAGKHAEAVGGERSGGRMSDGHDLLKKRVAKLAAAAEALKCAGGVADAPFCLAFMTDRRRIEEPECVIEALPAGAAVIYRDYDDPQRRIRAARYAELCRKSGVMLIVGADAALAAAIGAEGFHLPSRMLRQANGAAAGATIVTASCHDEEELAAAAKAGARIAFLSPVFPTASHQGVNALGVPRFLELAGASPAPVIALGGVDAQNARALAGPNVAGLAAIGAFC